MTKYAKWWRSGNCRPIFSILYLIFLDKKSFWSCHFIISAKKHLPALRFFTLESFCCFFSKSRTRPRPCLPTTKGRSAHHSLWKFYDPTWTSLFSYLLLKRKEWYNIGKLLYLFSYISEKVRLPPFSQPQDRKNFRIRSLLRESGFLTSSLPPLFAQARPTHGFVVVDVTTVELVVVDVVVDVVVVLVIGVVRVGDNVWPLTGFKEKIIERIVWYC